MSSGVAKGGPGWAHAHPNVCCEIEKDQDTLIEQSNILIKQSIRQVVPCQLTESGYATGDVIVSWYIFISWIWGAVLCDMKSFHDTYYWTS